MPLNRPLVFVGLPGCGKGTQGKLFKERLGTQHIDSGGTLRKLSNDPETPDDIKEMIARGYGFPGKIDKVLRTEIHHAILEANGWNGEKKDVILDGWARDSIGLEIVRDIFGDINFINFIISEDLSRQRMQERGEREGDMREDFREGRILAFHRKTLPIIRDMKAQNRALRLYVEGMDIPSVHDLLVEKLRKIGILV